MDPRFIRLRPGLSVDEAISYLRRQAHDAVAAVDHGYVLDAEQRLLGMVSLVRRFSSPAEHAVQEVMNANPVTVPATTDQKVVSQLFRRHNLTVLPVVDDNGTMKGVVTLDDIVDVVDEEATEDMQKVGGVSGLDRPYLSTSMAEMIRKRGGWLMLLSLGEMLTATAMGWYEDQIATAVVLALFVPPPGGDAVLLAVLMARGHEVQGSTGIPGHSHTRAAP